MAGPRSILLVEDHLYIRRMLTDRLSYARYRVTPAARAEDALQIFWSKHIDLVLTDLQLAGLSGFALAATLRAAGGRGARVPILAMTANQVNEDEARWHDARFTALIAKPFSIEEFATLANRHCRE
jgi:DNA-binding response OmpR family regulator